MRQLDNKLYYLIYQLVIKIKPKGKKENKIFYVQIIIYLIISSFTNSIFA